MLTMLHFVSEEPPPSANWRWEEEGDLIAFVTNTQDRESMIDEALDFGYRLANELDIRLRPEKIKTCRLYSCC